MTSTRLNRLDQPTPEGLRADACRRYERRRGRSATVDAMGAHAVAAYTAMGGYLRVAALTFSRAKPICSAEIPPFEPVPVEAVAFAEYQSRQYAFVDTIVRPLLAVVAVEDIPADEVEDLLEIERVDREARKRFSPSMLTEWLATPPMPVHAAMLGIAVDAETMDGSYAERAAKLEARLRKLPDGATSDSQHALHACRLLLHSFRSQAGRDRGHPPELADRVFASALGVRFGEQGYPPPTARDMADLHGTLVPHRDLDRARQRWRDRLRALARAKSTT